MLFDDTKALFKQRLTHSNIQAMQSELIRMLGDMDEDRRNFASDVLKVASDLKREDTTYEERKDIYDEVFTHYWGRDDYSYRGELVPWLLHQHKALRQKAKRSKNERTQAKLHELAKLLAHAIACANSLDDQWSKDRLMMVDLMCRGGHPEPDAKTKVLKHLDQNESLRRNLLTRERVVVVDQGACSLGKEMIVLVNEAPDWVYGHIFQCPEEHLPDPKAGEWCIALRQADDLIEDLGSTESLSKSAWCHLLTMLGEVPNPPMVIQSPEDTSAQRHTFEGAVNALCHMIDRFTHDLRIEDQFGGNRIEMGMPGQYDERAYRLYDWAFENSDEFFEQRDIDRHRLKLFEADTRDLLKGGQS